VKLIFASILSEATNFIKNVKSSSVSGRLVTATVTINYLVLPTFAACHEDTLFFV